MKRHKNEVAERLYRTSVPFSGGEELIDLTEERPTFSSL